MRRTHHTIFLGCEGKAEWQLARVIRDLYLPRNCGTALYAKDANGYGGARTLAIAIDVKGSAAYAQYGVLVDTDQHWGETERTLARTHQIAAIEDSPCIEAVLLDVAGEKPRMTTDENKAAFEKRFGGPAHRDNVIARHFDRAIFDAARDRVAAINSFLRLIRC
jgi:hypothetical protein